MITVHRRIATRTADSCYVGHHPVFGVPKMERTEWLCFVPVLLFIFTYIPLCSFLQVWLL